MMQSKLNRSFERLQDALIAAALALTAPALTSLALLVGPGALEIAAFLVIVAFVMLAASLVHLAMALGLRQAMRGYGISDPPPERPAGLTNRSECHCTNCMNTVTRGQKP